MCELCGFLNAPEGADNGGFACPATAGGEGDGFQINSTTTGDQNGPNFVRLNDGRFVVLYQSADTAGNGFDIRARIFDATGVATGTDFLVNQTFAGDQTTVALSVNSNGSLSFLWQTPDPANAGNTHLTVRSFDTSGNPLGAEKQVSTSGADGAYSFVQRGNGTIFVAYENNGDIYGRTFNANWDALTAEVQLNSTSAGTQAQSRLVTLSNGNILLAFQSNDNGDGGGGNGNLIRNRVFSTAGDAWTPVTIGGSTNDYIANTTGTDDQTRARVVRLVDNRVLEVWQSDDTGDGSGTCIRARILATTGDPSAAGTTAEFIVNTTATGDQFRPLTLSFEDGRRLIYWHSFEDGTDTIRGRFVHSNGSLDAADFVIGHLPDTAVPNFTLGLLANQQLAVVYSGAGSGDADGDGIVGTIGLAPFSFEGEIVNPGTSFLDIPLPSFTTDQAAAQISRTNAPWNDALGTSHSFTYSYRATGTGITYTNGAQGFTQFNAAQIAAAEAVIGLWEDVANIQLTRVQDAGSAYSDTGQFRLWNYASSTANSQAANAGGFGGAGFNGTTANPFVFLNDDRANVVAPTFHNDGFRLLIHEIGHALGLLHPGNYNILPNGAAIVYDGNAVYREDTDQYTVMSYFDETVTHANFVDVFAMTPLLHDIAAMQRLYGANLTTRVGDTVYGFNSNTGSASYSIASAAQHVVFAVWDAGGIDTLDFSGYTMRQRIDLQAEKFSSVGGLEFNVVIAKNVVIENAIGGSAADLIVGNAANNALSGGGGNDLLIGMAGADHLSGNDGFDLLEGGAGGDTLDGGADIDTATYEFAGAAVAARLITGGSKGDALGDSYIGIENLVGTAFADVLVGDAGNNILSGMAGNDKLTGGGGFDRLEGFAGADRLNGGLGADVMLGGADNDIYDVDNAGDQVIEAAGGGIDKVFATKSFTLTADQEIEFLYAAEGAGKLTLTGNALLNRIYGGDADDTLDGGGGGDFLNGGLGDDTYEVNNDGVHVVEALDQGEDTVQASVTLRLADNLENLTLTGTGAINGIGNTLVNRITGNDAVNRLDGGLGNDRLTGGGGNDTLIGGEGLDLLAGGVGNDIFLYRDVTDSVAGTARDRILDFAAGDRINLAQIDANSTTPENDKFSFIGTGAFTNHAGELRYAALGANTLISADVGGDGVADFQILLIGTHTLNATDFLL